MPATALDSALGSLKDWPVGHACAGVIHPGGTRAVGEADRPFALASVTKLLTAYAALIAVEEGAWELDQPLGPQGSTVRHLLAHASGVAFDSREQAKPVGRRRVYSSAGYEWLAEALEGLTETPFPEYLREAVCEPLGMASTHLRGSAGHGAVSTLGDLLLFARELLSPSLLSRQTLAEAFTPQFPELPGVVPGYGMHKPCPWGLGFEIRGGKEPHWLGASMPADVVGHFGMAGTFLWCAPRQGAAMVALTDREFGPWAVPLWAETNERVWRALAD
ncbi:beta-lactamase family protein [Corynebacterium mastitidis]|uniref:serine hydrolase domain-containing protein n=1 Tax=Corynebacterium mastitidis TaxID=161890 RepID=UPI00157E13F0|nr:serine hydrolase domain-containing protein [Corynebacterium mastitidis]MCH6197538.1 beta-lactamase family protein [Corynebacterium mastitidis]